MKRSYYVAITVMLVTACAHGEELKSGNRFQDDVAFLKKHVEVIVLRDHEAQVALVPAYQGRVMTSTTGGENALSFGWVNKELIAAGTFLPHINVFGGEDRFWIGPEGGQFSIFFSKGSPFDLEHWFTPAPLDTEPFAVVSKESNAVVFQRNFQLTNRYGTKFDVEVTRKVELLNAQRVAKLLGLDIPATVKLVAFESANTLKNVGSFAWKKDSGLLSIWILGMLNASQTSTVVIPFQPGSAMELGTIVNDTYFGKVPADRLVVKENALFFKADANCRSKIGIPPRRAKDLLGSYDANSGVLTIVQFSLPKGAADYVNSMWELQKAPFAGDVVNSYNDGIPLKGDKQLGRFYELETSSPALSLAPGSSATHLHRTIHLQGKQNDLEPIARRVLGASLEEIRAAMK